MPPRNQLNRHEKVARFWRPFPLLGSSQHRGQIPSQLDPELALLTTSPGSTTTATSPITLPNGIALSEDERHLYVTVDRKIVRHEGRSDGRWWT